MIFTQHDFITGLYCLLIISAALLLIEVAVKKNAVSKSLGRKLLHITAICTCAYAIKTFENSNLLAVIFILFFFLLLWVIKKGWMQVNYYKTYGIAFFPLAFALLLFMPALHKDAVLFAVLTLGISDAASGLTGERYGRKKIFFLFEEKSWAGFAAFFSSCFLLALLYFNKFSPEGILWCSIAALLPALTELFSYKGSDNLSVPVVTAVWIQLTNDTAPEKTLVFGLYILLFLALCFFAAYKKWLTASGCAAALWMALLLYVSAGVKAFIAPGIFLVTGSLLSKLNKENSEKNGRDALQVFCNGIAGVTCMVLYASLQQPVFLTAALVSFAVSMSDSTSSEAGVFLKGKAVDIITFRPVRPGLSGGVSWQGSIAGLLGAAIIGAGALAAYGSTAGFWQITIFGFAGMITDSVLGSLLQVKYKTAAGEITENSTGNLSVYKGLSWCNNNMVNVLSNLLVTICFIIASSMK